MANKVVCIQLRIDRSMQQAGKQTYMVLKNYINLIESVCDASSFSVGDRCMHARMAFGLHTSHNVLYCRHIFTEKSGLAPALAALLAAER